MDQGRGKGMDTRVTAVEFRVSDMSNEQLAGEAFKEVYAGLREPSRVILYLSELERRKPDSLGVLEHMGQDTGVLGGEARKILNATTDIEPYELRNTFGENTVYGYAEYEDLRRGKLSHVYQYALERGMVSRDAYPTEDAFAEMCVEDAYRPVTVNGHILGELHGDFVNRYATFGTAEPAYVDLIGCSDVMRLRERERPPRVLLLGSFMEHSAREFAAFCKKIDPRAEPVVMDLEADHVRQIERYRGENDLQVIQADARDIPNLGGVDIIMTNHLFHEIAHRDKNSAREHRPAGVNSFDRLWRSVSQALAKDGMFVIAEQPFGFALSGGSQYFKDWVVSTAEKHNCRLDREIVDGPTNVFFRADVMQPEDLKSGVQIRKDGTPNFQERLLVRQGSVHLFARFRKA